MPEPVESWPFFIPANSSGLQRYSFFLARVVRLTCFHGDSAGKESACNVGDLCLIPGLGRSPGGGKGSLPQYSCLEHPVDRGTWRAAVHGVSKSQTRLNGFHLGRLTKPPPPLGSEIGPLRLLFWVPPTGNTQGLFFLFS